VLFLHLCVNFNCSKPLPPSSGLFAFQNQFISLTFSLHTGTFLVLHAKLREATISFVMFVRLSVRMELVSHWTEFHEI